MLSGFAIFGVYLLGWVLGFSLGVSWTCHYIKKQLVKSEEEKLKVSDLYPAKK